MYKNFNLSDKKHLFFNMTEYYNNAGQDPYLVLPLTFVVEDGISDPEFTRF
jgi:hypothetical protein